ncbi:5-carboxymethyl-2-hydroxymuconate Delta-isomerase [Aurantimonas sp. VKM B-3413]|uniref:5-carboxymethyl-2-hydroxymuconate Delta-isomerase n=1 Tax=Aurantimonas sp. VKM B-3413 TaxID=2779401 RepID=UPI001E380AD3|nr:5-carboxymethyl-2-hydroxymuconate Delta-isomerase [Aurantimonas sp. VKM B-3413]MCB8836279.1 5-carboxymethyl-2-hydroxymuconate Delta-isomerase [Aurantimonas sp. VKM B-3413]
MPHLILEHSANLSAKADLTALCHVLKTAVLETGLFETGAVRVRAISCETYAIADELPDNAFLDMSFRIGVGRSDDEKKRAGKTIFAAAQRHLEPLFDTPHFALSLEIREIDPVLSWKKNAMHARLREPASKG